MADVSYPFYSRLAKVLNSNQSRSVILCGNIHDLFHNGCEYVPLIPFLCGKCNSRGIIRVVYELNGPVRILDDREKLKSAWIRWKSGVDPDTLLLRNLGAKGPSETDRLGGQFEQLLLDAIGNANLALELLRQLTICARTSGLGADLLIFIEAADMLLPAGSGDIAALNDRQLHRISIVQDWFSDPAFTNGRDSVCLVAESRSLVHPRVSRLPQVLPVEIPCARRGRPPALHRDLPGLVPGQAQALEHAGRAGVAHRGAFDPRPAADPAGRRLHGGRRLTRRRSGQGRGVHPGPTRRGRGGVREAHAHASGRDGLQPAEGVHPRRASAALPGRAGQGPFRGRGGRPHRQRQDVHPRGRGRRARYPRTRTQEHPQPVVRTDRRDFRAAPPHPGGPGPRADFRR